MFYSHDLLTNRQYGVATIWLVATLESKSNLKKVTRKAITDVNVPRACETIKNPETPLALRLQASLLYGVSRVHAHQCGYMLTDMHSFKDKMRGIEQIMRDLEIDPDIGRTRPEQLNLPEDPAFMPELDLDFDLSAFLLPSDTSPASSILSPQTMASSHTSLCEEQEEELGLVLPSWDTPGEFGGPEASLGGGTSSGAQTASKVGVADVFEESPIIEDPEFEIAEDGRILALPSREERDRQHRTPSAGGEGRGASKSASSARVRAELEGGLDNDQLSLAIDDDHILFGGDDDVPLPPAQPFSPQARPAGGETARSQQPSAQGTEVSTTTTTTTTTAEAPQHRMRRVKQLQADNRAELSNRQLGEWNDNYTATMAGIARHREQLGSLTQARKNAAFWIMEQGIGGVEVSFGEERTIHPLAILSGQTLLDALRGREGSPAGSKRSHSPEGENGDSRRVRARTQIEQDEVVRGTSGMQHSDGINFPGDDDVPIESEIGRHAPSSLPDRSSALPWNILGSRHGSAPTLGSTGFGVSSSAGDAGVMQVGSRALSRRGSRLTSASPLVGKGIPRLPSLELHDLTDLCSEANFNSDDLGLQIDSGDLELYGASATVGTQTAQKRKWVKDALDNEAHNFLEFLKTQITERGKEIAGGEEDEEVPLRCITLNALLPPADNARVVGAQALLHILALTTKGLVEVEQKMAWEDIRLTVVPVEAPRLRVAKVGDE